jgi:SAM-dependent methyltransferase
MRRYAFDRSWSREGERVVALERQLDPVSQAVAVQLGLVAGWRCWEAGAGGGSMALWLAAQVTASGSVLATDIDLSGLAAAVPADVANITIARHDLEREKLPGRGFDLVHARLVLEHVADPGAVVVNLAAALRPGGWLIVEDADGLGFDAEPPAAALPTIAEPWQRAARSAGWDPMYGRRLVADLRHAGLTQASGRAHRNYLPGGGAWTGARLGIERMRDQIQDAGASPADIDDALAALADPARVIIGAPILSAWGQRPA